LNSKTVANTERVG